ncbi:MAG: MEDS domain-containing protein [Nitrospiraceae bacterium]|nr:MEDS domain-containing protein [Nitrospiraceae bacterium]
MHDPDKTYGSGAPVVSDMLHYIDVHDHVCMVYETLEEQFSAVSRFMEMGLQRRERCICITDESNIDVVLRQMTKAGIRAEHAMNAGALSIITKHDSYLKQGYFDPDQMIDSIREAADDAESAGFKALRVIGDMSWASEDYRGVERLIEYESRVDGLFPDNNILAICQYDRTRFSQELINTMIAIHPCCWL